MLHQAAVLLSLLRRRLQPIRLLIKAAEAMMKLMSNVLRQTAVLLSLLCRKVLPIRLRTCT